MPDMQNPPSPERIFATFNAYQQSAALKAAIELDVFTAIGEGKQTPPELAERCGASERGLRILCDYLTIMGLLGKADGRYSLTPESGAFLDRRSPAYIGSAADFLIQPQFFDTAKDLASSVRKGGTDLPGEGTVEDDHPIWQTFARAMMPLMRLPAQGMVDAVPVEEGRNVKVLDIAAGHGIFGITFAQRHPNAEVTALDWPKVLEVAEENAAAAGVRDRYRLLPGSAFDVDYGEGYDFILLTNFLHHFDPPTNVVLLKKVRSALAEGGRAVTVEFVPNEDRVTPPMTAAFSLTMLMGTRGGDAYTFQELDAMFREAGFSRSELHPLPHMPQQVIVSQK